ncbi:MAG: iron-containing alcohol dehydrogenase, partial [Firmicutes bacterium]|nr:iron-containing alcohol dehydrogenase [Bacillota bacterium]
MIIDCKQYDGVCACGKGHHVVTRLAVIEAGCLTQFEAYMDMLGLTERRAVVYDEQTYQAKGLVRPAAQQEIILPGQDLCANERAVATVLQALRADTDVLVAVGGGTLHDIVRYCGHKLRLPFVACPTAASVDGYASGICSMTLEGVQTKVSATAPVLVLADVDVLASAPERLTAAGLGEALGKFTTLTDWRVANLLMREDACPAAEAMILQAAVAAQGCGAALSQRDAGAVAQLMYALLLSGIAAQMMAPYRPASASEHHLAYLMDLMPGPLGIGRPLLHGEKIGVSTLVAAEVYQRLARIDDITPYVKAYKPLERAWL